MDLKPNLLRGIYAYGYVLHIRYLSRNPLTVSYPSFERPSTIHKRAIMPMIKGHDVVAQAQSGLEKASTFSIPILQKVRLIVASVLVLI